jgi:hypothetical protein
MMEREPKLERDGGAPGDIYLVLSTLVSAPPLSLPETPRAASSCSSVPACTSFDSSGLRFVPHSSGNGALLSRRGSSRTSSRQSDTPKPPALAGSQIQSTTHLLFLGLLRVEAMSSTREPDNSSGHCLFVLFRITQNSERHS